ncbi:MAG: hypothetical protein AAFQ67_06120 [Pseudomonadota bacterium]
MIRFFGLLLFLFGVATLLLKLALMTGHASYDWPYVMAIEQRLDAWGWQASFLIRGGFAMVGALIFVFLDRKPKPNLR